MNETRYLISDTSKQLKVEPHVLRYWEEELDMKIKRNEMGHRYYTTDDIRVLQAVKEMKAQGLQLKAIKQLLPELYKNPDFNWKMKAEQKDELLQTVPTKPAHGKVIEMRQSNSTEVVSAAAQTPVDVMSAELKMEQFQEIMTRIIGKALEANNRSLTGAISNEVSDKVSERVIKQMDYVMRESEERQEERFRKLDEVLRTRQRANAEAAAAAEEAKRKHKKSLFTKKQKQKGRR